MLNFLFVCPHINILLCSLTYASVMRSMTQSSADTSSIASFPPSATPPPSYVPNPALVPHIPHPIHPDTLTSSQPQLPLPPQHSFFDIANDSILFSPQSKRHVTRAIQNGWASSTVKRYSGSIKQFIRFCDMEGIPNHLRFPADEFVLCAFAASSAGVHSRSTPRNRLSALKAWHVAHNLKWNGSARLRYILNGVHNLMPHGSKLPPRPPISARMIIQLIQHLDLDSPFDIAIAACAATAFWGQCRLGELLPSSLSILLLALFPRRSSLRRSARNRHSRIIRLPHTKTHQHGQDVVLVDQCNPINPITLIARHLQINDIPHDAHLFSYATSNGFSPLTKPLFLRRCNEIWRSLGYPRTTGHCFRIGGTTELLLSGTPPDVVKATGRWSSDSFLRYWRSLEDIAPYYIRRLHDKKRRLRRRH